MANKKARLLVTLDCHRKCAYCCNKQPGKLAGAIKITALDRMVGYEEIMISGGEPMLIPDFVQSVLFQIRNINPTAKVYLYTASYRNEMEWILPLLDGVVFSIHEDATDEETHFNLTRMEYLIHLYGKGKSFRLNVVHRYPGDINIRPDLWSRINFVTPLDDCPVPEGEDLFILT